MDLNDQSSLREPLLNQDDYLKTPSESTFCIKKYWSQVGTTNGNRSFMLIIAILSGLVSINLGTFIFFSYDANGYHRPEVKANTYNRGKHNSPTLLSIVDPETNRLLSPSEHNLYHLFQSDQIEISSVDPVEVEIKLDKNKLKSFHESLTVQINVRKNILDPDPLRHDDILRMRCGPNLFEVATLEQVLATTAFHNRGYGYVKPFLNVHESSFYTLYIPKFPIIREKKCVFTLLRRIDSKSKRIKFLHLAIPSTIRLPSLDTPTGLHLALTNDPSEMVVQFITASDGDPFVEVTHPNNNTSFDYEYKTTTYTNEDLCQAPANSTDAGNFIAPGNLHSVILNDLTPDTNYTYRVGLMKKGGSDIVYTDEYYSFTTAPVVGSKDPFAFIAFGDQGCPVDGWAMGGQITTDLIKIELDDAKIPIRAVHHFGDLSYARGHAHIWDAWLDMIQVYTSRVPLMVGVGNHEYDHTGGGIGKDPSGETTDGGFHPGWGNFGTDSGGECGVPTAKRFYTPENGNGVFWYSYDTGLVHTIMISSEHSLHRNSRQLKWLENDLKNVNRKLTPWIIVESHRPLYHNEFTPDNQIVEIGMRYEFEDILIKYNVDLFLAGHFHSYLRTCSGLYRSKCNNGGPTHITVGTAGAHLDWGFLMPFVDQWTEKFLKQWGYGKVVVYNETALHWSFISVSYNHHGEQIYNSKYPVDEVWLKK